MIINCKICLEFYRNALFFAKISYCLYEYLSGKIFRHVYNNVKLLK